MARGVFPHEIIDPDYQWLIRNYCEKSAPVAVVDSGCLPVVMILLDESARSLVSQDVLAQTILGGVANAATDEVFVDDSTEGG